MKTLLQTCLLAAGLGLALHSARAAEPTEVKSVQFKDGKVMVSFESGDPVTATNEVALPESVKVMTNGTFTVGSGKKRNLKEGQILDADGNLTSPDGTVVPVADHVVLKGGRLTLVKDGESTPATGEVRLGDGSRIRPDGTITGAEGRIQRMLDGQICKFNGESIASTDTVTVKDGKVILQKDGGRVTLKPGQTIMMSNGTKVGADGSIVRADGTRSKVGEGEILKLPGVLPRK
jgi:hypothetical protein